MKHDIQSAPVKGKAVLVRMDLDLPSRGKSFDQTRLEDGLETVRYLLKQKASIITIIGHRGRPEGRKVANLSLKKIEKLLRQSFSREENKSIVVLENLRFDPGEEKNGVTFAKKLAKGQDLFVNDAFASSHREHASIVGVASLLPSYFGFQFMRELRGLEKLVQEPKRPFVAILGGSKLSTKLPLLDKLTEKVDVILVGGKISDELLKHPLVNRKLIVGELAKHGKDISDNAVQQFSRFILMAHTLVWNGPLGKCEDKEYRRGTLEVARTISRSRAYSVAGGGDTEAALSLLKETKSMKFISSGGGAMLEYVAYGTLPGIEAVKKSPKV